MQCVWRVRLLRKNSGIDDDDDDDDYDNDQGENYIGVPGDFAPEMQKEPSKKEKKLPLKIAIDCNVKSCSMLQI